jgi:small nuclear ribonucleoprotein (snRNP)-like protein
MFEIKLFLSTERNEFNYELQQYADIFALFGGFFSSLMIIFRLVGFLLNMNMILANSIELLYLVDHNEMEGKPTLMSNNVTKDEDLSSSIEHKISRSQTKKM